MKNDPKFERGDIVTLIGTLRGKEYELGDVAFVLWPRISFNNQSYIDVVWINDTGQTNGTYYESSFILKRRGKLVVEREINPDRAHRIIKQVKDGGPRWGGNTQVGIGNKTYWHKIVTRKEGEKKKVYYLLYEKGVFLKAFKRHYLPISLDGNRKQVPTYIEMPTEFGRILDMSLFPWRPAC